MPRLQGPHLGRDPEQLAEKILDMRRQIDDEVRFGRMPEPLRIAPRRHQSMVQRSIAFGKMADKRPIDPHQPVAVVKIGERKFVFQAEVEHPGARSDSGRSARFNL